MKDVLIHLRLHFQLLLAPVFLWGWLVAGGGFTLQILLAATVKGILISLLTALSLGGGGSWWRGAGFGMLYGFAFGLVIFLAKGAFKSKDAPYVVPASIATGLITGLAVWRLAFG